MERWRLGQLAKGNSPAGKIAEGLIEQFGDIDLPSVEVRPLPAKETPIEIKRFSAEQREALEKQGFVIYSLTGQSIKTLRDSGYRFLSIWHNSLPDFEALGSMHSEVAINPDQLFLPRSNNQTLTQQEEMVEKFSQELGKKVQGVGRDLVHAAPLVVPV